MFRRITFHAPGAQRADVRTHVYGPSTLLLANLCIAMSQCETMCLEVCCLKMGEYWY